DQGRHGARDQDAVPLQAPKLKSMRGNLQVPSHTRRSTAGRAKPIVRTTLPAGFVSTSFPLTAISRSAHRGRLDRTELDCERVAVVDPGVLDHLSVLQRVNAPRRDVKRLPVRLRR